jgi:hypothetical protein
VVDVVTQIKDYLDLLGMKYTWDNKEAVFELVFSERKDAKTYTPNQESDGLSFKYTIYVHPGDRWVQVYTDVISLQHIPEKKRNHVFLDLLRANRKYAEVCFDFDEENGMIGTSQEMMSQGLNFDGFREEFLAVPWAVKCFWTEIAAKYELE